MHLEAPRVPVAKAVFMHHELGAHEDRGLVRRPSLDLPRALIRARKPPFDFGIICAFSPDSRGCQPGIILQLATRIQRLASYMSLEGGVSHRRQTVPPRVALADIWQCLGTILVVITVGDAAG